MGQSARENALEPVCVCMFWSKTFSPHLCENLRHYGFHQYLIHRIYLIACRRYLFQPIAIGLGVANAGVILWNWISIPVRSQYLIGNACGAIALMSLPPGLLYSCTQRAQVLYNWNCYHLPYTKSGNHWTFHFILFTDFAAQLVVVIAASMWLLTHHKLSKKEAPRWASGV